MWESDARKNIRSCARRGLKSLCITSSSRGKTDEGKRCHNICDDIDNRANLPDSIHHKLPQVYSSETKLFM